MALPQIAFLVANKKTKTLMDFYSALYGPSRKGQLSTIGKLQFSRIRREIEKRLQIVEVTPDKKNSDLHEQMAGKFEDGDFKGKCKDLVHEFGVDDADTLREWRLGGEGSNKTAFALIDPESREVLAAIYVHRSDLEVTPQMAVNDRLQGNVFDILHDKPRKLERPETSLIFYSISRFGKMNGEGELLISKLHSHLSEQYADQPDVIFSTLSPFRNFGAWLEHQGVDLSEVRPNDVTSLALQFLLDDNPEMPKPVMDLVRRFHLSNGAEVIGIRTSANSVGSKDAKFGLNLMIHYGYPRDPQKMFRNAAAFAAGDVRVSERLPELARLGDVPLIRPKGQTATP